MTTSPMVISGLDAGDWVSRYLGANPPIPGWFSDEDVWLFCVLDQLQAAAAVQGDLLEIGGYLGKSAVALGYILRQEETLVVVDPWDSEISDPENAGEQARLYPDVTFDRFKMNYQRFHPGLPDMRRGISSQCLPGLDSGRYRFIHVDGSHEWEQVEIRRRRSSSLTCSKRSGCIRRSASARGWGGRVAGLCLGGPGPDRNYR